MEQRRAKIKICPSDRNLVASFTQTEKPPNKTLQQWFPVACLKSNCVDYTLSNLYFKIVVKALKPVFSALPIAGTAPGLSDLPKFNINYIYAFVALPYWRGISCLSPEGCFQGGQNSLGNPGLTKLDVKLSSGR